MARKTAAVLKVQDTVRLAPGRLARSSIESLGYIVPGKSSSAASTIAFAWRLPLGSGASFLTFFIHILTSNQTKYTQ